MPANAFPEMIAGRYRLLRELGRGGMGNVYEAEHANTGERVALKTMLVGSDDRESVERFRREARAFAKIGGEHVVRVIDADTAPELDGAPFLVMELLDGSDLARMLAARGRLSPDVVVEYLSQTGAAIERAHAAGVIHRDLKPENVFVHRSVEGREIVKVLDFGIAKAFENTALTRPGARVGTPTFMAPEQARGQIGAICPQTDVWALGMIAFELLTNEHYWTASNVAELFEQILNAPMAVPSARWAFLPRGFDAWFARSCAREIRSRWPSVREQMDALRVALRTDVGPLPATGLRNTPARAGVLLLILSGGAIALLVFVLSASRADDPTSQAPRIAPTISSPVVSPVSPVSPVPVALVDPRPEEAGPAPPEAPHRRAPHVTAPPATTAAAGALGALTVVCLPKCDAIIDNDIPLGPGHISNRPVPSGRHVLQLSAPNGVRKRLAVEVLPEQTKEIRMSMNL